MESENVQPIALYGSKISYFTGKLENYFRFKGLAYTLHSMQGPRDFKMVERHLGLAQMPSIQLGDGRWMTDTTKIIQWFETEIRDRPVIPENALQAFLCYLIEDYADEWLWRPAMHYRWHYPLGAHFASRFLVDELMGAIPLPASLKRWGIRFRQRSGYTRGDGITKANVAGVEGIYLRTLEQLQAIFERRRFIFGDQPSLADIGFAGPFFRHFGLDPVPLAIMRQQAPAVLEWVARLWNCRPDNCGGEWVKGVPDDLGPLLDEIGRHYLPYLCANAASVKKGSKRFDADIGGIAYKGARYSRYRVWCMQELRNHFNAMPQAAQEEAKALLEKHHCWEPLWRIKDLPLLPGQEQDLPFKATTKMVSVNE